MPETIHDIIRWLAAILSVIAAIGVVLTIKQFTGRFHSTTQWIRAIATIAVALLMIVSLMFGRYIEQVRRAREHMHLTDLAETKQALEALRQRTQPRQLSAVQTQQLSALLTQGRQEAIVIEFSAGDGEAYRFAEQLARILQQSGWTIREFNRTTTIGIEPIGIIFWIHRMDTIPPGAQILKEFLDTIGLQTEWRVVSGLLGAPVKLLVGHKPD
jgi:hypothetical protein